MTVHLCTACGTSYPDADQPPANCPICDDERQYVPAAGQSWISREALARTHRNAWLRHEANLLSVQPVPAFAINQRAFHVRTPAGNILWDCISLLDPATVELVAALGGVRAIAISHPHYYTVMQDWAAAFGARIHLHAADRDWLVRPDPSIEFWTGDSITLVPGVTLVRAGGHFHGGTVLHWAGTEDGAGALLVGDIVQITPGARRASFMWSYPNLMPLPAVTVRRIADRLAPLAYRRIYGAFAGQDVTDDGPALIARSAARYIELLENP